MSPSTISTTSAALLDADKSVSRKVKQMRIDQELKEAETESNSMLFNFEQQISINSDTISSSSFIKKDELYIKIQHLRAQDSSDREQQFFLEILLQTVIPSYMKPDDADENENDQRTENRSSSKKKNQQQLQNKNITSSNNNVLSLTEPSIERAHDIVQNRLYYSVKQKRIETLRKIMKYLLILKEKRENIMRMIAKNGGIDDDDEDEDNDEYFSTTSRSSSSSTTSTANPKSISPTKTTTMIKNRLISSSTPQPQKQQHQLQQQSSSSAKRTRSLTPQPRNNNNNTRRKSPSTRTTTTAEDPEVTKKVSSMLPLHLRHHYSSPS